MNVLNAERVQTLFAKVNLPFTFTPGEISQYDTTPIVISEERVLAFPTPAFTQGLSILGLRERLGTDPRQLPCFFDHPWYLDEEFGKMECPPGCHYLNMDVLKESIQKPYNYSHSLPQGVVLPMAVEVVLMLFLHYLDTGEQLLLKKHTWCSDRASMDRAVTVGAFGRNGVFISGHPENFASLGLGICGKRVGG